jgi:hypothetical protein
MSVLALAEWAWPLLSLAAILLAYGITAWLWIEEWRR